MCPTPQVQPLSLAGLPLSFTHTCGSMIFPSTRWRSLMKNLANYIVSTSWFLNPYIRCYMADCPNSLIRVYQCSLIIISYKFSFSVEGTVSRDYLSFDTPTLPYGGSYSSSSGSRLIPGRGDLALLVPLGHNASLSLPIYHECLGHPAFCPRGVTLGFWLFPNVSLSSGWVSLIHTGSAGHGISLVYTSVTPSTPYQFRLWTQTHLTTVTFDLPKQRWSHVMIDWVMVNETTLDVNSTLWVNGTEHPITPDVIAQSLSDPEEGATLTFSLDSGMDGSFYLIDEFHFHEEPANSTFAAELFCKYIKKKTIQYSIHVGDYRYKP